jgi:hypothetical protein
MSTSQFNSASHCTTVIMAQDVARKILLLAKEKARVVVKVTLTVKFKEHEHGEDLTGLESRIHCLQSCGTWQDMPSGLV